MLSHWGTILTIVVVGYAIWVGTGALEGWMDVKSRPKVPMEWCHRHGYFKKEHCLVFMDTTVCPRCYRESWNKAGKI